jgi:hypothetical protein
MSEHRSEVRARERFVTEPAVWRFVARGAALGLIVGLAGLLVASKAGGHPSPALFVLAPVIVSTVIQLVRAGAADFSVVGPPIAAPPKTPEYFLRLRQLERRLDTASKDVAEFDWSVRPLLAGLITDRLNYKHGINIDAQPDQARALMGDQLWQIISSQSGRATRRDPAWLTEVVRRIELL